MRGPLSSSGEAHVSSARLIHRINRVLPFQVKDASTCNTAVELSWNSPQRRPRSGGGDGVRGGKPATVFRRCEGAYNTGTARLGREHHPPAVQYRSGQNGFSLTKIACTSSKPQPPILRTKNQNARNKQKPASSTTSAGSAQSTTGAGCIPPCARESVCFFLIHLKSIAP